jgi:hypothetical protein
MIDSMTRRTFSGPRVAGAIALGVAWLAVVFASIDRPLADARDEVPAQTLPRPGKDEVADRLPGTWLREHSEQGVQSRRLLRLQPGGEFQEQVRIVNQSGEVSQHEHAGTWLYDGVNLKRKYTLMNGRAPSRLNLPFATFEIRFDSRNEFVGTDHIHRNTVRYRRVATDAEL